MFFPDFQFCSDQKVSHVWAPSNKKNGGRPRRIFPRRGPGGVSIFTAKDRAKKKIRGLWGCITSVFSLKSNPNQREMCHKYLSKGV